MFGALQERIFTYYAERHHHGIPRQHWALGWRNLTPEPVGAAHHGGICLVIGISDNPNVDDKLLV